MGSSPFSFADCKRHVFTARWPLHSDPANSQLLRPIHGYL